MVGARGGHLRDFGLSTIFGSAVLFVCATLLLGVNISALRSNLVWVEHSQAVLRSLTNLETSILGEELTVRGYALTGDKRFLEYQGNERAKTAVALNELVRLTSAEPGHAKVFRTIQLDVARHLATYGHLKGTGPGEAGVVAQAIVNADIRASTSRIRMGLAELRNEEQQDLATRQREMATQISRAFFLATGIILAAIVLGAFGLLAAQLHIPLRRQLLSRGS